MSNTTLHPTRTTPVAATAAPSHLLLVLAVTASAALAVLGGRGLLAADHNPLVDPETVLIRALLGPQASAAILLGLGLLGVLAALLALLRPEGGRPRTALTVGLTVVGLTVVGLVEVLGLGLAFQSVSTMSLAGYLVAMALPFGLLWIAVQSIRRYRRARWVVLAGVGVALSWGLVTGAFRPAHLAGLAGDLGQGFASHAAQLILVILLGAAAACWVLVLGSTIRRTPLVHAVAGWVRRHRRALTFVAAAGPLPYGLIRTSWLTPWPLLAPNGEALDPEMRLWGLLLGGGAVLGAVLTVGLIRPWGVVFPRWMPWLGGRPVPVRAAVVPGGLVAGITCAAALPMLQLILFPADGGALFGGLPLLERLLATLIFPFFIWGPALALAVWGYALARRQGGSTRAVRTM